MGLETALQGEHADQRRPRRTSHAARAAAPSSSLRALEAAHRRRRARARPRRRAAGPASAWSPSTIARARVARVLGLEDARAHEDALGAERHHQRRVGRRRDAARAEQHAPAGGPRARRRARDRAARAISLGLARELLRRRASSRRRISPPISAHVAHGLDDVAGAGLALGADHRGALADSPQRLAEVGRAADERHLEAPLVDVVGLVGRRQDLATRRCSRPRAPPARAPP